MCLLRRKLAFRKNLERLDHLDFSKKSKISPEENQFLVCHSGKSICFVWTKMFPIDGHIRIRSKSLTRSWLAIWPFERGSDLKLEYTTSDHCAGADFTIKMDCAPNVNIFCELQAVHDTGYFSGQISPEDDWQQVSFLHVIHCYVQVFDNFPTPFHQSLANFKDVLKTMTK